MMKTKPIFSTLFQIVFVGLLITSCAPIRPQVRSAEVIMETPMQAQPSLTPTQAPTSTSVPTHTPAPSATPEPKEPLMHGNPQQYSIIYSVAIHNRGFSPSDIRLYLPMPGEWDAQKELRIGDISPAPQSQKMDEKTGNGVIYWRLQSIPKKNSSEIFTLPFDLTAYETNTYINPATVKAYQTETEEYKLYTRYEKYIEVNDPKIRQLADEIAGAETNPYLLAKKFYDYIIDTEKYKLLGQGLNGAKYILENGNGECGDYSALFIALSRAKGIPARPVVGYWAITGNNQTHVWAEFFLEGIGWIPVDATIGQQSAEKRAYYFGNMDNQRVVLSKGFNHALTPPGPEGYITPLLQVPMWWFWGSGDASQIQMERNWIVKKQ